MASRAKQIARARSLLYAHSTSIKKTSAAKRDDTAETFGKPPRRYVAYGVKMAKMPVADFDRIQRDWYPPRKGVNQPCSVDAMHLGGDGLWYAIEFKIGCVNTANLVRKIHETIMGCKEHLGPLSQDFCGYGFYRKKMVYVVVASDLEMYYAKDRTFYRTLNAYREPWEQRSFPIRWHLKPLEGILVSRYYELSPTLFARFAKEKKWV